MMEKNIRNQAVKAGTSGNQSSAKAKQGQDGQGDGDIGKPSMGAWLSVTGENHCFQCST